jgi:glycosyltransferase involved in cell wall biosynthesis
MLRIAIFLNTSWNIYNFRLSLLKALQSDGHQIICIAPKDEYSERLIHEGFTFIPLDFNAKSINPLNDCLLLFKIGRILRRYKPDILLNYTIKPNLYGTIAARFYNIKTINNVSGLGTVFLRPTFTSYLAKEMYRMAFKYPNHVFFQNKEDQNLFVQNGLVRPLITDVLPGSGVDLSKFCPDYSTHFDDTITFLMPARLLIDKGVYEYITAAKHIKRKHTNVRFLLIGKPDYDSGLGVKRKELKLWIEEKTVEYYGFTDHMKDYYTKADCVVLPSYREGTSKTLLEALAMGKPIITTDVPGCRETVDPWKNGLLCKAKDSQSLIDVFEKFIELDPVQRLAMGKYSRFKAEVEFDEKFVINKYKKVIFEL